MDLFDNLTLGHLLLLLFLRFCTSAFRRCILRAFGALFTYACSSRLKPEDKALKSLAFLL